MGIDNSSTLTFRTRDTRAPEIISYDPLQNAIDIQKDKTIILTGAMIPIKFGSSDGLFNLGSALSFIQTLNSGIYITMNGRYFNVNNVYKNKKLGIFEQIKK